MSEKNKQWLENGKQFSRNFPQGQRVYGVDGCSSTPAGNAGGFGGKTGIYAVLTPNRPEKRQNGRRFKEDGEPMFTLTGQDIHGVAVSCVTGVKEIDESPTLDTCYRKGLGNKQARCGVYNGLQIRRLTPTECERLQGFPDNWTEGVSDTQRYKQCGNAVTTKVIKSIMEQLIGVIAITK